MDDVVKWAIRRVDRLARRLQLPIVLLVICGLAFSSSAAFDKTRDCYKELNGAVTYKATDKCNEVEATLEFDSNKLKFEFVISVDTADATNGTLKIGGCTSPLDLTVGKPPAYSFSFNGLQVYARPALGTATAEGVTVGNVTNTCKDAIKSNGISKSVTTVKIKLQSVLSGFDIKFSAKILSVAAAAGFFDVTNWVLWVVVVGVLLLLSSFVGSSVGGVFVYKKQKAKKLKGADKQAKGGNLNDKSGVKTKKTDKTLATPGAQLQGTGPDVEECSDPEDVAPRNPKFDWPRKKFLQADYDKLVKLIGDTKNEKAIKDFLKENWFYTMTRYNAFHRFALYKWKEIEEKKQEKTPADDACYKFLQDVCRIFSQLRDENELPFLFYMNG